MPMPRWFTAVTKHVFNPAELRRGKRPVIVHTGRRSGAEYRTPLDAHSVEGGWLFVLVYGSESDWCQNALAAGSARLVVDGREVALTNPRVVQRADVLDELDPNLKPPPGFLNVTECLRMDEAA
jgi:deazaflavin-dependent oxidoreductase (nitroreductase family)